MRLAPKRDAVMAVLRTIENLDEVNIRASARQRDCTWEVVRLALIKLKKAKQASPHRSAFVFPGISRKGIDDKPIGGRGVNYELEKTFLPKHPEFADVDFTVHGFRSSAASWARENFRSDFPEPELLRKLQLGHVVSPGALGRYERGQLIEARRPLVEAWDIERDGVEGLAEIVIAVANEIGFRGLLEEVVFAHVLDDRRRRAPARLSLVKSDDPGPDAA